MLTTIIVVLSAIATAADSKCPPGMCLSQWGYCGTGDAYCKGSTSSPPDPAHVTADPSNSAQIHGPYTGKYCDLVEDFSNSSLQHFQFDYSPEHAKVSDGKLKLTMDQSSGVRLSSLSRFQDVQVEAKLTMSAGEGVVTSFILKSDKDPLKGDEVDFEMVGKNPYGLQTNFFVNAQPIYTNAQWKWFSGVDPQGTDSYDGSKQPETLGIKWNNTVMIWSVNGKEVRRMDNVPGQEFPTQAMYVQAAIWDGTQTSGWAGTTDWSKAPYTSVFEYIKIQVPC